VTHSLLFYIFLLFELLKCNLYIISVKEHSELVADTIAVFLLQLYHVHK